MKILVSGRDGQVARSLGERGNGHELVFAGRPQMDLADPASIERTIGAVSPDLVVSAAAYTAVDAAEAEPELAMQLNGEAPGMLARAAAGVGARLIHLSTDYVFDGGLDRPWREDDPVAPLNVYGRTKLAGEQAVAASSATHLILRTAWVFSPFGRNFVRTMLHLAESRDRLNVVEDQNGCPTSAFDVADAIMAIAAGWQREPAAGANSLFHFAGSGTTSWAGFARAIFQESAARGGPSAQVIGVPATSYPTPARRPANSCLDSAKFARVFGHRAPPWRTSLARVMDRLMPGQAA